MAEFGLGLMNRRQKDLNPAVLFILTRFYAKLLPLPAILCCLSPTDYSSLVCALLFCNSDIEFTSLQLPSLQIFVSDAAMNFPLQSQAGFPCLRTTKTWNLFKPEEIFTLFLLLLLLYPAG